MLEIRYLDMPVSDLPVSAGTGAFLDEGNFEMVSFPESSIPDGAEFGVRVSGDSMEPVYHDGQIVWVQQCETLRPGEVGVMIYDGQGLQQGLCTEASFTGTGIPNCGASSISPVYWT